ncbi:Spy/CpxP family protein refolding chaperone [Persephonella sp.]
MRIIIFLLTVMLIWNISFAQEEATQEESGLSIEEIKDDSWMDGAFLIKRFNFLPALKKHKNELGLTDEQLKIINSFYSKYYRKMEELAKSIQDKEKQLSDLILNGGDSKKIKDLIVEIAKEKAELTVYNIKEVRTIQNALTKEQFEKLKNLTEQSII